MTTLHIPFKQATLSKLFKRKIEGFTSIVAAVGGSYLFPMTAGLDTTFASYNAGTKQITILQAGMYRMTLDGNTTQSWNLTSGSSTAFQLDCTTLLSQLAKAWNGSTVVFSQNDFQTSQYFPYAGTAMAGSVPTLTGAIENFDCKIFKAVDVYLAVGHVISVSCIHAGAASGANSTYGFSGEITLELLR